MNDFLVKTLVEVEDKRFYSHFGVDPVAILRSFVANLFARRIVQGGSTLTQQLARNIFLVGEKRSLLRKTKEALIAIWLEQYFTKDQIVQLYLENIYMGHNLHGFYAASKHYFDKELSEINKYEAIVLISLLRGPNLYKPKSEVGIRRQLLILTSMCYKNEVNKPEMLFILDQMHREHNVRS
jgi:penicillin-binding protein 1A